MIRATDRIILSLNSDQQVTLTREGRNTRHKWGTQRYNPKCLSGRIYDPGNENGIKIRNAIREGYNTKILLQAYLNLDALYIERFIRNMDKNYIITVLKNN